MGFCLGKQSCILPTERNHVGINAVKKDMRLILNIINIIQVTSGGVTLILGRCLET
jgi:hypothetical protein